MLGMSPRLSVLQVREPEPLETVHFKQEDQQLCMHLSFVATGTPCSPTARGAGSTAWASWEQRCRTGQLWELLLGAPGGGDGRRDAGSGIRPS